VVSPRLAVSIVFLLHGLACGTWISRIPAVQEDLGLPVGSLGLALLGSGLGSLVGLLPTGALIARYGSRQVCQWTGLVACGALALLATASSGPSLFGLLVIWGASAGALDVSMNAQGSTIEQQRRRPIMSSLHGLWSAGCMAGSAAGAVVAGLGVSFRAHFIPVAVLLGIVALLATRRLAAGDHQREPAAALAWPRGTVLALAAIVFCAVATEGAMLDWGGVYLRRVLDAPEAVAASAGSFFGVAMALGRFSGDRLTTRWSAPGLARASALLAGLGVLAVILAPGPEVVLGGLVLAGLGVSVLVPLAFAAAGRSEDLPASTAIAMVATVGYAVFMIGPPTIGLASERFGMRAAFLILPVLLLAITVLAPAIGGRGLVSSPRRLAPASRQR
jgi:fucose permease